MDETPVPAVLTASVCIPTYNRRDKLLALLRCLGEQTIDPKCYEVIVTIDGSTDGTERALANLHIPYRLQWIARANAGTSAARNAAARLARSPVIIFLDDDQLPAPELIASHLEAQRRCGDALIQGTYPLAAGYDRMGASLVYERARARAMKTTEARPAAPLMLWAGNFSVRADTYRRLGGFDESFTGWGGEDTDFGLRASALGIPFIFEELAISYHQLSVGYDAFRKQAYSAGRAAVHLSRKHALPLADLSPTETGGWLSGLLTHAWRVSPVAADTAGHLMTGGLWLADRLGLRPVQIVFAQLVRRIYKVGGITLETLEQSPTTVSSRAV